MSFTEHSFKKDREKILLVAIFLLAVVLRIAYVIFLKQNYFFFDQPSSDVKYYQLWAQDIASGNWIGEGPFYGMPLYAYFLAVLKRLVFNNDLLIRTVHLLLGSFNCILVYYVTKRIFPAAALLASLLTATNFTLIYYDWLTMPVSLISVLLLTLVIFLLNRHGLQKRSEWLILGILFGLTALGDGKTAIFFVFCCALLALCPRRSFGADLQQAIIPLIIGFMLIVGGCALRNKLVSGDWILISAQSGLSFYVGNSAQSDGLYNNPEFIRPTHEGQDEDQQIIAQATIQRPLSPGEISAFWRNEAVKFIRGNPVLYAQLLIKKFSLFFREVDSPDEIDLLLQRQWKRILDINSFYVLCPLSVLGLLLAGYNRIKNTGFINLVLLSQLVFTVMFFLTIRHRATVLPFLIMYEAYFFVCLLQWFRSRSFKLIAGALLAAVLYWITFKPLELPAAMIEYINHANAGVVCAKKKKYKLAQAHYLKALQLQPFDTNTLFNLANSYFYEGDYTDAQKYYEKVLTLFPSHADARFNLGYTLEKVGELDRALDVFMDLHQDQPQRLDLHYRLVQIYAQQKKCSDLNEVAGFLIKESPALTAEMQKLMSECR